MIRLTRLDGKPIVLNAEWIQSVEQTPDTLITLTTGFTLIVLDTVDDVVKRFLEYKRQNSSLKVLKGPS
jgi:flagellar protein FlbD